MELQDVGSMELSANSEVTGPLRGNSAAFGFRGKVYLDPKEPPFLGFLNKISLYKSLKRLVIWG